MNDNEIFDSLSCIQRLQAAGMTENQAKAIAEVLMDARRQPTITKQPPRGFDTWEHFKKLRAAGFTEVQAETFIGELVIAFWGFVPGFYKEEYQRFCDGR